MKTSATALQSERTGCINHGENPLCKCPKYDLKNEGGRINFMIRRRNKRRLRTTLAVLISGTLGVVVGIPLGLATLGDVVATLVVLFFGWLGLTLEKKTRLAEGEALEKKLKREFVRL